ncbi:low-density lipoprotein receptor 2 [Elysia marginata]|uniref:Low-density lipoprotein receptor 2 n=1 Tax=Elysia marginata TaxID=1093978 RepID=A0AAV4GGH4_9GAST|nr:low-density lipoprotein receptor 2 [Elysia marginata]
MPALIGQQLQVVLLTLLAGLVVGYYGRRRYCQNGLHFIPELISSVCSFRREKYDEMVKSVNDLRRRFRPRNCQELRRLRSNIEKQVGFICGWKAAFHTYRVELIREETGYRRLGCKSVTLFVHFLPTTIEDDLQLSCLAYKTALSPKRIVWLREAYDEPGRKSVEININSIRAGRHRIVEQFRHDWTYTSTLSIRPMKMEDFGTYRCRLAGSNFAARYAVEWKPHELEISGHKSEDVYIKCLVRGEDKLPTSIHWFKTVTRPTDELTINISNYAELSKHASDDPYKIENIKGKWHFQSVLRIKDPKSFPGTYTCRLVPDDQSASYQVPLTPAGDQHCEPNEFACGDNKGCLPDYWACDGRNDCQDWSDENSCGREPSHESSVFVDIDNTCSELPNNVYVVFVDIVSTCCELPNTVSVVFVDIANTCNELPNNVCVEFLDITNTCSAQ